MEITTATTRVVWPPTLSSDNSNRIATIVNEAIESGKLISRSSPDIRTSINHTVVAVWKDLATANEYLATIKTLGPISAEII